MCLKFKYIMTLERIVEYTPRLLCCYNENYKKLIFMTENEIQFFQLIPTKSVL